VARQRIGEPTGLILETEDIQRTCRELRARGVQVGGPPEPVVPETAAATFRDPDGNELMLVEASAADGDGPGSRTPRG
jgi:predicted enzyme related to lactoylglutathione lyase